MRHAASSVPGPSKSVGSRQAHESADVALCPRQARLRIDGELFVSWSTRNAALIAALVRRRRNALHGVEVIDAAAIVLLTRRRRRPVSSWRFFARARAAQARRVDEIIKEADAINQRVDAVVSPPRSSRTGDVMTRGLLVTGRGPTWLLVYRPRKIVSVKSSAGYSDSWSLRHILRSIQRVTASLARHRRDAVWDKDTCTRRFQVMPFRDPALFEQFNCKPLNAAAAPDASVPITPGETEEAPKNRRLSRFNEL